MYTYNDGLESGSRRPRLYLTKAGKAVKFLGENIEGYCVIASSQYKKNGKWSNTTYQLELAPGVKPLSFLSPLHGTWGDNFTSWGEVAENLGLPIEVAREVVGMEYPKTEERLDEVEKFALDLEAQGEEMETVVISFGSPSNRAIREGYWSESKFGQTSNGVVVEVVPTNPDSQYPDWNNPTVTQPQGAKIISSKHSSGMHGGYWAVEVAVPMKMS